VDAFVLNRCRLRAQKEVSTAQASGIPEQLSKIHAQIVMGWL